MSVNEITYGDGSNAWDCDHHPEWCDNRNRCHHPAHARPLSPVLSSGADEREQP